MDLLYNEYILNRFADIDLTNQDLDNPEWLQLYKYVDAIQAKEIFYDDIPIKYRQMLADFITRD